MVIKMERYIVSACLVGKNTKYNGGNNKNNKIIEFLKDKEYITVCPEVSGGLPTPRHPSEIINDKVINDINEDVTIQFKIGSALEIERVKMFKATKAILKSKSPSCGVDEVYDGTFTKTLTQGDGIFVKELKKLGIEILTELDF